MVEACAMALRGGRVRVDRDHEPESAGGVGDFEVGMRDLELLIAFGEDVYEVSKHALAILAGELGARRAMVERAQGEGGR
jgi:hypothetical protein